MADGDQVEKPAKIDTPQPRYPIFARQRHVEGTVIVQSIIDREGKVRCVTPLEGVRGLTATSLSTIRRWRFHPATHAGEPVAVYYNLTTSFSLGPSR